MAWLGLGFLLILCISYSNHFSNPFEFDDFHTIVNNEYIREIKNIPSFFTDIKYFGTNPGNQGYRPVLVTLNAIDYWLAGELKPEYFHVHIFLSYIGMLALVFLFFNKIFDFTAKNEKNRFLALLATAFYGLHAANAETINYICQRSDMGSTLWILAALLLYQNNKARKYYFYLVAIVIALGTKETGAVTGLLLFFLILFFEEHVSLAELITFRKIPNVLTALRKSAPALLVSFGLFFLCQKYFFQDAPIEVADDAPNALNYYGTQLVVFAHYIGNFIIPIDLSVDPDFTIYVSILDKHVLFGFAFFAAMVFVAFKTSSKKETRPIAYGILWFFIALAPTSLIPNTGQIANDHRTFFPYIGLVLSLGWWLRLLYLKYQEQLKTQRSVPVILTAVIYVLVISLHAYGTYQRNIVWGSSATLWRDATIKSPKNGRAQMNYGLTLMREGKYDETLPYFQRTLELLPRWAFIHLNMGILREAMGFSAEAEQYFKNAIYYQPNVPDSYYYYAQWLEKKGRTTEAIAQLEEGLRISPGHAGISQYLSSLSATVSETPEQRLEKQEKLAAATPTADNYINLSLEYYRAGKYEDCIKACEKALQIDPRSALAYNNMGSAYNSLGQWEKGAEACTKALEIDPNFERARNNLNWAQQNIKK